jgi:hypothetical protein
MIFNILEDLNYKEMLEGQIFEVLEYLINKDEEFSLTANINGVSFDPEIPETISKKFSHFTLFTLSNYTYQSIILTEKNISFEAGFGSKNFGSHVTIPLCAIFQIVIDESILFLNPTATVEKYFMQKEQEEANQELRSMNAFTLNTKNKDLLS